jgi:hypothetical protein
MKDGSYTKPYRLKSFGSLNVVNCKTDLIEECAPATCPKGKKIPSNSELDEKDRTRILVESHNVGKLINRVPFYWSGGFGTGICKSASLEVKDLMWDLFVYINTPITSKADVVQLLWLDEWRASQMDKANMRTYLDAGYSKTAWREHSNLMNYALEDQVNVALMLCLPGILAYTQDVMLPKFAAYMNGDISMADVKKSVREGWEDATSAWGKLKQVQIFRASLGLDALLSTEVCRLHPKEIGAICENSFIGDIRWIRYALGFIIIFMAVFFGGWVAVNCNHRVVKMS